MLLSCFPQPTSTSSIGQLVSMILRTRVMTRDQNDHLNNLVWQHRPMNPDEMAALEQLLQALAVGQVLTYPDLCL